MTRIDHGTRRGYQQHKAIGSMVCGPCREANNAYQREYMRATYDPAKRRAAGIRNALAGYSDDELATELALRRAERTRAARMTAEAPR